MIKSESQPAKIRTALKRKPIKEIRQHRQERLASQLVGDDDDDWFEITDIQVGYRRPTLVDEDGEEALSEYVVNRLKTARILALIAYNKAHG